MRRIGIDGERDEAVVTLDERFVCDTYLVRSKRAADEGKPSYEAGGCY